MSQQITGKADRVYVPDAHGEPGYRPIDELVSMLRVFDKGPDVLVEVMVRGIRSGQVQMPRTDEEDFRRRVFADLPRGGMDVAGEMVQELEDFAAVQNIEGTRLARRRLMAYIEQLRYAAVYSADRPTGGKANA